MSTRVIDESISLRSLKSARRSRNLFDGTPTRSGAMKRILLVLALFAGMTLGIPSVARPGLVEACTEQGSPKAETKATEPSVAVDRSDGTVWVAWQASGTHVARSDDGGRSFAQTPIVNVFGNDVGDVDVRVGGPTPCVTPTTSCLPGTRRVYVTSLERLPLLLQTHLAYSDDRGAHWTVNNVAAVNPSFIDRPWLAVYPSRTSALQDSVYIAYHDFSASQIWVASSHDGGQTFVQANVFANDPMVEVQSFCNTVPSGIEVDPQSGDVYVLWITADPVANTTGGCNITQVENFHQVWVAHSASGGLTWDAHQVFDGGPTTNTDEIFASLALDASGNVYSAFADNLRGPNVFDIWFTHSSNKGATWARPALVNGEKRTHCFPWIAAGSAGRVDFIWLNSPAYTPTDAEQSPWYVTFAQTTNGTSATPTLHQPSTSS